MAEDLRYVLAKKIARGGMAEIYLGKHVGEDGFQRLCAIKRILPHYAQDQEFIQMFRDEAHICKRLQHANIVRVEGFEEVEGSYAIIMEFVDGADLRTLLHSVEQAKKRMPVQMASYIVSEAARGLHYAHTKVDEITQQPLGIVHRDISPQNILVSFEGEVKVTDFGIADAESKLTETRPGIVKGKYSYMSPEQIAAKPVDARTDVFALSIVLWEMLAMRRLFQGENEVDTIQRVKNCKIEQDLRQLCPEVDEELDQIVRRGLAKDPRKRYKTAADFEKDLRRYMSRKHPDFTPEDLGDFLKKNMESRRNESAADIKKTLTETNLRPGRSKTSTGRRRAVDLALEEGQAGLQMSLARPSPSRAATGLTPSSRPGAHVSSAPFARPPHTRNSSPIAYSQKRSSGINKTWLYGVVALIALVFGLKVITTLTAQPKPAQLMLRTQPPRVKIYVDGKPATRHGRYVLATTKRPARLILKPGVHTLKIMREGYETYKYEFRLDSGEHQTKDDIVLKGSAPSQTVRLRNRSPEHRGVVLDINDGFYLLKLRPGDTRAHPLEFLQDHAYRMRVLVEGERDFTCVFRPRAGMRQHNDLTIDLRQRRCRASWQQ